MPNRILKESICVSDSISCLSWFEEVLFYRLIVNCDDYGRFDGRISVIKNRLFPLKDNLTIKTVSDGINKLASAGLVALYEFEGKPYLYLPSWNDHQNVRAKRSRYPAPVCNVNTSECKCNHVQANVPVIQSVSESVSESNPNVCAEPRGGSTPESTPVILLPLNDGCDFGVTAEMLSEFSSLYPAVDVMQELRNMRGWLLNNAKNRKTRSGIRRFINSWLSREQDRPKTRSAKASVPCGATGELGEAELAAIQRVLRE